MFTSKTPPTSPVDPSLLRAAARGPVDAVVLFDPVTDRRSLDRTLAAIDAMPLGPARKTAAFRALHATGTATLAAHRPALDELVRSGRAAGVDELWSIGAVRLRGVSLDTIRSLAMPGVRAVVQDEQIAPPSLPAGSVDAIDGAVTLPPRFETRLGAADARAADADPSKVWMDWGVQRMNAPAAWAQGITGAGIVIGSLDTGIAAEHPLLRRNYRGARPDGGFDHDYNWKDVVKETPENGKLPDGSPFDPVTDRAKNKTSKRPIDLNGHGTHTSGSAVGWDPNHITGVAPDAKLIGARGLGEKGGSMFALVDAMQWFMAPTKVDGSAPRPDLAPDIVTNSWGGQPVGNPILWAALRAWKRSGIIPVFASGNDRKAQPGKVAVPGMYPEAITVGASDLDERRTWFSMYGPSDYAVGPKPEVLAPGHWTYSALPDGTVRDTFPVHMPDGSIRLAPASGTSMATPHVAGAVALYLQAHPGSTFDQVLDALKGAGTLSTTPTQDMGWGRVQVDRLISPDSIAPGAKRTSRDRVEELMGQVARAAVFKDGERQPGPPTGPIDS